MVDIKNTMIFVIIAKFLQMFIDAQGNSKYIKGVIGIMTFSIFMTPFEKELKLHKITEIFDVVEDRTIADFWKFCEEQKEKYDIQIQDKIEDEKELWREEIYEIEDQYKDDRKINIADISLK